MRSEAVDGCSKGKRASATGAGYLDRILVTARDASGAKKLVLINIAGQAERADNSVGQVRGMRGTQSGLFDFSDADRRGGADRYARRLRARPAFRCRRLADQGTAGGVESLVRHMRDHRSLPAVASIGSRAPWGCICASLCLIRRETAPRRRGSKRITEARLPDGSAWFPRVEHPVQACAADAGRCSRAADNGWSSHRIPTTRVWAAGR
jgi:hypothetical protein